ncbi:MAG: hypothetical protein AVDCRST_MAG06-614 [uncultured Nocardioides sp.]|uniref:Uncharacterized protein n=1 Tax=uncultured Nocardioides sp. TaxID=198441 RepID=A0A6J4N462_9ACTN|nr:MAG: hypothetical protein AVDCRST_MAG06-614 [uncultured Nocardioides sp.]
MAVAAGGQQDRGAGEEDQAAGTDAVDVDHGGPHQQRHRDGDHDEDRRRGGRDHPGAAGHERLHHRLGHDHPATPAGDPVPRRPGRHGELHLDQRVVGDVDGEDGGEAGPERREDEEEGPAHPRVELGEDREAGDPGHHGGRRDPHRQRLVAAGRPGPADGRDHGGGQGARGDHGGGLVALRADVRQGGSGAEGGRRHDAVACAAADRHRGEDAGEQEHPGDDEAGGPRRDAGGEEAGQRGGQRGGGAGQGRQRAGLLGTRAHRPVGDAAGTVEAGGRDDRVARLHARLGQHPVGGDQLPEGGLEQRDGVEPGLLGVLTGDVVGGDAAGDHQVDDAGRAVHAEHHGRGAGRHRLGLRHASPSTPPATTHWSAAQGSAQESSRCHLHPLIIAATGNAEGDQ